MNLMKRDEIGKMGSGPMLQHRHSETSVRDDTIVSQLIRQWRKNRHKVVVEGDISWGE
jgi:hypothetical protein